MPAKRARFLDFEALAVETTAGAGRRLPWTARTSRWYRRGPRRRGPGARRADARRDAQAPAGCRVVPTAGADTGPAALGWWVGRRRVAAPAGRRTRADQLELYLYLTREQARPARQRAAAAAVRHGRGSGQGRPSPSTSCCAHRVRRLDAAAGNREPSAPAAILPHPARPSGSARCFLTHSAHLKRFLGADVPRPGGCPPNSRTPPQTVRFRPRSAKLLDEILARAGQRGQGRRPAGAGRVPRHFFRTTRRRPRYDAELVWEEIRAIVKGRQAASERAPVRRAGRSAPAPAPAAGRAGRERGRVGRVRGAGWPTWRWVSRLGRDARAPDPRSQTLRGLRRLPARRWTPSPAAGAALSCSDAAQAPCSRSSPRAPGSAAVGRCGEYEGAGGPGGHPTFPFERREIHAPGGVLPGAVGGGSAARTRLT